MRFVFAGDRDIAVWTLDYLLSRGDRPSALLVSDSIRASHAVELREMCAYLPDELVLTGREFRTAEAIARIRALHCDYILGVHFPYLVPEELLHVPSRGVLNLHPAFLPYNRGWHTPSWAILDGTPIGATLHFMDTGLDTGDIVYQQELVVRPADTANTLYARLKELELEVFRHAWPDLAEGRVTRTPQAAGYGSAHKRSDLFRPEIQRIDLEATYRGAEVLRVLRALTTNQSDEAAYFEQDGRRYRIRVQIEDAGPLPGGGAGFSAGGAPQI